MSSENSTLDDDSAINRIKLLVGEANETVRTIAEVSKEKISEANQLGYAWLPIGIDNGNISHFEKVFKKSPDDADFLQWRVHQSNVQLPSSDFTFNRSKFRPDSVERRVFDTIILSSQKAALCFGQVATTSGMGNCQKCNVQISEDSIALRLKWPERDAWYHCDCFDCVVCSEILVDFIGFCSNKKLYCGRHFNELFKPRCNDCGELILASEYTRTGKCSYHAEHFCCESCKNPLGEGEFYLENAKKYCTSCYQNSFSKHCFYCGSCINANRRYVSFNGQYWHKNCFACYKCTKQLQSKPFVFISGRLCCGECHGKCSNDVCNKCAKSFDLGATRFLCTELIYHRQCYVCSRCDKSLCGSTAIPRDKRIFCEECYKLFHFKVCHVCGEQIQSNGIMHDSHPYHTQCLRCNNCKTELYNQKFALNGGNMYCSSCYGNLFATKCTRCSHPISGFTDNNYVTYEKYTWHSKCFSCKHCTAGLQEHDFVVEASDVVCVNCKCRSDNDNKSS